MSSAISEATPATAVAAATIARNVPTPDGASAAHSAPPSTSPGTVASPAQVQAAVDTLNEHFSAYRGDLKFKVEKDIGVLVVSVVDAKSGEVLMQIPTEQALQTAREVRRGDPYRLLTTTA